MMPSRTAVWIIALTLGLLGNLAMASSVETIELKKTPDWIVKKDVEIPAKLPLETIEGGVYYALSDNQIRVPAQGDPEYYAHYAEMVVNRQGMERSSQLRVEFDPTYESLVFHSIQVRRDGDLIDKFASAQISVIQRETELENLIYDGRLTANVIIDDVRVGDIVEYSYTLSGANPVYKGKFATSHYIEWSVPLYRQHFRVLWGKQRPLYVTKMNTDVEVRKNRLSSFIEYSLAVEDAKPRTVNTQTPDWYDPFGAVLLSETKSWSDVVFWALPLYENAIDASPEVIAVAEAIRVEHPDLRTQIKKALEFVQNEVRYLGIEMGVNSHMPSPAVQTIQRRYGDCKDKVVLLISILKELGVTASPALVNTRRTQTLINFPATVNAFNHVIVKVWHGDDEFWLDPTWQYQKGGLADIYSPDYRYALVVKEGTDALEKMKEPAGGVQLVVNDRFDLSKGSGREVIFESRSEYAGYEAEKHRYNIAEEGITGLQTQYLEFHRDYYSELEAVDKIQVSDKHDTGKITMEEKYLLKKFWQENTEDKQFEASFHANIISPYLSKPEQENRNSPYSLAYPVNVKQNIEAVFEDGEWAFDNEELTEDNRFFFFTYAANYDKATKVLRLNYQFETRTDFIAAADLPEYLELRKKVLENTEYPIFQYFQGAAPHTAEAFNSALIALIIIAVYIAGIFFAIGSWLWETKNSSEPTAVAFYPVSLSKLLLLSIATVGIYQAYWFCKNWQHAKRADGSSIMPLARGIFSYVWYYPFYLRLVQDSRDRYQANRVLKEPLAVVLALAYVALILLQGKNNLWVPILFLTPLLLFPLANYINHIDQGDGEAYAKNSRWRLRHTTVAVLFVPFVLLVYGSELNILPSEKVVEGQRIWAHDLRFMQRNKIFPADERVVLFYSDDIFSIRNDGNGFTDRHVFSYWKDGENKLNVEREALSRVQDITVTYSTAWHENTVLTVVRKDGSEFLLFASAEKGLDKKFVSELMKRWKAVRER